MDARAAWSWILRSSGAANSIALPASPGGADRLPGTGSSIDCKFETEPAAADGLGCRNDTLSQSRIPADSRPTRTARLPPLLRNLDVFAGRQHAPGVPMVA